MRYVGEKWWDVGGFALLQGVMHGVAGAGALWAAISVAHAHADSLASKPATAGEIVSVEGTVFVRPDKYVAGAPLSPARAGDAVHAGDVINSASDGKLKILMKDHTIIDLGPSALFKIDQFKANQGANRQVEVNMLYGSVRAAVAQKLEGKGRFKLRTPSAVMGVRGTEFVVKSEAPDLKQVSAAIAHPENPVTPLAMDGAVAPTQVTVVQGRVDVEPQTPQATTEKPVVLTAGTQLTTQVGDVAAAKPVALDALQLNQVRESAKVQDNTFQKAVVVEPVAGSSVGNLSGAITRQAVASAVSGAVQMAPAVAAGTAGFAGTFGNSQTFTPVNQNFLQAGMLRTVSVDVIAP